MGFGEDVENESQGAGWGLWENPGITERLAGDSALVVGSQRTPWGPFGSVRSLVSPTCCENSVPSVAPVCAFCLPFAPGISSSAGGLLEAVAGQLLTAHPRRECCCLQHSLSFLGAKPQGAGGKLHIWAAQSAGMR